jgi:hypothetical protein
MRNTRPLVVFALTLVLIGQMASAQDMSRYRAHALESSLDSVIAATGARAADLKTLHDRLVVNCDRARTQGLTDTDIIESISASDALDKTRVTNKAAFRPCEMGRPDIRGR